MSTPKERSITANTLVCLLNGLENEETTIDLRNGVSIYGKITKVLFDMDVRLKNVQLFTLDGTVQSFDEFYLRGRNIRYVHIPDHINMLAVIKLMTTKLGGGAQSLGTGMVRRSRGSKLQRKLAQKSKLAAKVLEMRSKLGNLDETN